MHCSEVSSLLETFVEKQEGDEDFHLGVREH